MRDDAYWMEQALVQAQKARELDEVPVGAVVVYENQLVGEGFNCPIRSLDPTAHAEVVAIRKAAAKQGNYRLTGSILYVTLEPCAMCVAAACAARIQRIVFGAVDEKMGSLTSDSSLLMSGVLLRKLTFEGGIKAAESRQLLQAFFRQKRRKLVSGN